MTKSVRDLPRFHRVTWDKRVAMIHPDFAAELFMTVLDGKDVLPSDVGGRGELMEVPTEWGTVLVREYLRGGMAARFLRDSYVLDNRPLKELNVHSVAWRAGVPTVMPVGAMWERSGFLYRGAYATLRANAQDLLLYLQTHEQPNPVALAACGHAIRAMHDANICHADLQVKNLLIEGEKALIIDFDRARVMKVTESTAESNLARLKRSFEKRELPLSAFDAIADAYRSVK